MSTSDVGQCWLIEADQVQETIGLGLAYGTSKILHMVYDNNKNTYKLLQYIHTAALLAGGGALPALVAIRSTAHALLMANGKGKVVPEVAEGSDWAMAAATW